MKKTLFLCALSLFVLAFTTQAQSTLQGNTSADGGYQNSVGLSLDLGSTYVTGAGVGFKHFFSSHDAGEFNLLFYNSTVSLGAYYEYHGFIQNAPGLKWYFGLGPQLFLAKNNTNLAARVPIGLDYKIPNVPLNFAFDWRPMILLTHGTEFTAARFGIGIRFAF